MLMNEEKIQELQEDFMNLLESYWYILRTKDCKPFSSEQEELEHWAKELMIKWKIM